VRRKASHRSSLRTSISKFPGGRAYSSQAPDRGAAFTDESFLGSIRFSYENGIQTFDTANVSSVVQTEDGGLNWDWQVYSNGLSEVVLGKAIKQLNLPREEIVVMTKVRQSPSLPVDAFWAK
jgi:aryl-alcohol dehydrogenase-like predicted oxidoreductase